MRWKIAMSVLQLSLSMWSVAMISPIVHMVVENLRATGVIPDEGGWNRSTTSGDTSDRRCVSHDMSPSTNRLKMTGGDTLDRRCESHNMSPGSNRPMTGGDTSNKRCEGHEMSPSTDRLMTGGDTSGEGVRVMIGAQLQNAPEPMWWLDMSG